MPKGVLPDGVVVLVFFLFDFSRWLGAGAQAKPAGGACLEPELAPPCGRRWRGFFWGGRGGFSFGFKTHLAQSGDLLQAAGHGLFQSEGI